MGIDKKYRIDKNQQTNIKDPNQFRYEPGDRSTMRYSTHDTKKFYINTTAKTASSWCAARFDNPEPTLFHVSNMTIDETFNETPSESFTLMKKDWNSLVKGKSCKKDFIFLIRNPLEKLVTGFIQDVLLKEIHAHSLSSPIFIQFIRGLGYTEYETEAFCNYYNPQFYNHKDREDYNNFPDVNVFGKDDVFLPMYYDIVETIIDHWANDLPRFINEFNSNHKESNLIFILKLLAFPPNKLDVSKIRVIDINRQNLGDTLKSIYGIKVDSSKVHARTSTFKHLIYLAFTKHIPLINAFLSTELTLYSEIINKLYPCEIYATNKKSSLPNYIYPIDKFLSQEEISGKDAAHLFKEPFNFKILQNIFQLKTRVVNSNLTQIRNTINSSNGSLETILKKMEKEEESVNASSIASQYLV